MATFTQIKEVRLTIDDPSGYVNIVEVDLASELPETPAHQTAYLVNESGAYVATEKTIDASPIDYVPLDIMISDVRLGSLIDTYGSADAICRCYHIIASKLFSKLTLVRTESGAESTQYVQLRDAYYYYKELASDCKAQNSADTHTNTGRFLRTRRHIIGGGNL